MSQKLTVFRKKRIRQLHQNCILRLAGKSSKKKIVFFWRKHNVLFCLGVSVRKILVMDEKFMVALLDLLCTCLANMPRVLDNLNNFSQISGFEQNEVGLLAENFPQDCRHYIIRVQKIILRRGLLYGWKIFPKFFWIKSVSYLHFWSFFLGRVFKHECILCRRMLGRKNFWEKKYKILSSRLDSKQKRFGLLAWEIYLFGAFDDKFPNFVKKFCWFVRAEFHPFMVLLWAEQYLLSSENFLMDYAHPAKSFAGIRKLHSTCPIKPFGNFFCEKI